MVSSEQSGAAVAEVSEKLRSPKYRRYVLGVLVVVYVFNFLDRRIVTILA